MPRPYVREDRALKTWITFPSEQLRRAYVLSSAAIVATVTGEARRDQRLTLLIRALGGEQTDVEPKD